MTHQINIQPPSDIYDTFGRLNYKPWYAIAEFVDNATQNFYDYEDTLRAAAGADPQLQLDITYEHAGPSLTIRDDAHGMNLEEFSRALRINARPPKRTGRSEFGMGLKTAACWFGTMWRLTSTRLGEDVEYEVTMDLDELNRLRPNTIQVTEREVSPAEHGTTLFISPLRKRLYGRQIERIKTTLASMYRFDLLEGRVRITWNGEGLFYEPPDLWSEDLPDGSSRLYRQAISLDIEDPNDGAAYPIEGWVGILKTMSNRGSGFALFRRGRLILGGPDEGWRPAEVSGQAGSPEWKRLVGELRLDSFPVNFSKDGFAWDGGLEEKVIEALAFATRDYRVKAHNLRTRGSELATTDLGRAAEELQRVLDDDQIRRDLARLEVPIRPSSDPIDDPDVRERLLDEARGPSELKVPTPGGELIARLYLKDDDPRVDWLTLSFAQADEVDVFLNTRHPFVAAHTQDDASISIVSQFALALALAEKRARMLEGERILPDDLRTHLDVFLKHFTA